MEDIASFLNPPLRIEPRAGAFNQLVLVYCVRCTYTSLKMNYFSNEISLNFFILLIVGFRVPLLRKERIRKSVNDSFIVPSACPK